MVATPPLIALNDARLAFGATTLFSGLSLTLATGERACLVGRNGTGKSTLLKVIAGLQDLDGGERFVQPGTRVAYLPQDPTFESDDTIADYVARDPQGGEEAPRHAVDLGDPAFVATSVAADDPGGVAADHKSLPMHRLTRQSDMDR